MRDLERVVILAGGVSPEREVSLHSGYRVRDALAQEGIHADVADADAGLLSYLRGDPPSAVFPAIHGACGEDGAIREVLGLLGVPYVGSVASACQMAFDSPTAKALVAAAGLITPLSVTLPRETFHDLGATRSSTSSSRSSGCRCTSSPPRRLRSRAGPVRTAAELPAAVLSCFAYGDTALIERLISGTEVAVGVIDLGRGPQALPAVECVPGEGGYDYSARYTAGKTEFYVPARLFEEVAARSPGSRSPRIRCWACVICPGPTSSSTTPARSILLEVNVSPGMTETSTLPLALEASGHSFGSTFVSLLELAAARGA